MADGMTLLKAPTENISAFNKRLKDACGIKPVTEVSLFVIDGEPLVTLFSELVEANEEDVAEAKEGGETLELGELIPEEAPMIAQVTRVECLNDDLALKSQQRTERLFERADGGVQKLLCASGTVPIWVTSPEKKTEHLVQQNVHYVLVAYLADGDDDGDGSKGDAKMERDLRAKA